MILFLGNFSGRICGKGFLRFSREQLSLLIGYIVFLGSILLIPKEPMLVSPAKIKVDQVLSFLLFMRKQIYLSQKKGDKILFVLNKQTKKLIFSHIVQVLMFYKMECRIKNKSTGNKVVGLCIKVRNDNKKINKRIKISYKQIEKKANYQSRRKNMDQTMQFLMTKTKPMKQQIEANPWDVIPIKNSKQAKNTTEIHLGDRSATILTNFQHFPNLQIVWLNKNNLTTLSGIEKSFRIKHLFLQNNKLKSLDNVFYTLKYVESLVLYDNQLRDLDKVLQSLKPLSNLKHLDLYENPVSQEPNYKFRVLYALPTLEILDRHKISHQERDQAIKFMAGTKGKTKSSKKPFSW